VDADELQDVARTYAVAMSMRLPEEVEADVSAAAAVRMSRRGATG
jgi:hypothetical protein